VNRLSGKKFLDKKKEKKKEILFYVLTKLAEIHKNYFITSKYITWFYAQLDYKILNYNVLKS